MSELQPPEPIDQPEGFGPAVSARKKVLVIVGVPAIAIVAILIWGVTQTGGQPGRPGVNDQFGNVTIDPGAASDFRLTLFDGTELLLSGLLGNVVMVDFWGCWIETG